MSETPILIAVKAQAQHGKDTVVDILIEKGFTRVAFADPLKECMFALDPYVRVDRLLYFSQAKKTHTNIPYAEYMRLTTLIEAVGGWDEAKAHPDVRRLLQRFGTEVGRDILGPYLGHGDGMWIDIAENRVNGVPKAAISDLRFPNEYERTKELNATVWEVFRPNFDNGVDPSHPSEKFVREIPYDFRLLNSGDENTFKDVLRAQVEIGLNRLFDKMAEC